MNNVAYENPQEFLPEEVLDFIDLARLPQSEHFPQNIRGKWLGGLKRSPEDFEVVEPVPDYPGRPENLGNAFLTTGPDSDMPGLNTGSELTVELRNGVRVPAVAATLVKTRLTTWAAVDWLAKHLSQILGRRIAPQQIHTSGLKDRWAVTAQTAVVTGVTMEEMRRVSWWPYSQGRAGFFLKDIRPTDRKVYKGDHLANGFRIKVRVEGKSKAEIEEYINPRIEFLARGNWWIPNAFGRQRLGRRQNLHVVGRTLLTGDHKSPEGCNPFISAVEAATFRFLFETSDNEQPTATETRKEMQGQWQYNFQEMEQTLRRVYRKVNMSFEYKIVQKLADTDEFGGSCEAVMEDMNDEFSLWVGAWQAYYWNRHLARELTAGRLRPGMNAAIPLLMSSNDSKRYYGRTDIGQQALREMDKAEPIVRDLFLTPRDRRTGCEKPNAPWRKAFIKVDGFEHSAEDGVWTCSFALRSGSYATMLAGLLWDLSDPDDVESETSRSAEGENELVSAS